MLQSSWAGAEAPRPATVKKSEAGHLLVAQPGMRDPRFENTVILLVEHNATGAYGLVLNRVLAKVTAASFFEGKPLVVAEPKRSITVHYGGPVQPHGGVVLYKGARHFPDSTKLTERVAVSGHDTLMAAIALNKGPEKMLFAVGYAGWTAGQLEDELRRGVWVLAPASDDILFDQNYTTKWKRAFERRFRSL